MPQFEPFQPIKETKDLERARTKASGQKPEERERTETKRKVVSDVDRWVTSNESAHNRLVEAREEEVTTQVHPHPLLFFQHKPHQHIHVQPTSVATNTATMR